MTRRRATSGPLARSDRECGGDCERLDGVGRESFAAMEAILAAFLCFMEYRPCAGFGIRARAC